VKACLGGFFEEEEEVGKVEDHMSFQKPLPPYEGGVEGGGGIIICRCNR